MFSHLTLVPGGFELNEFFQFGHILLSQFNLCENHVFSDRRAFVDQSTFLEIY